MADRSRIDKRRIDREVSRDKAEAPQADPGTPRNRAWDQSNPGQGGEGLSKGYGGSAGTGTGPSGPEGRTQEQAPKERIRGKSH